MTGDITHNQATNQQLALEAMSAMPDTARVRVTRTIVYEGNVATVRATLDAPNANCRGVGPARYPGPSDQPHRYTINCIAEEIERLD